MPAKLTIFVVLSLLGVLGRPLRADDPPPRIPAGWPDPAQVGRQEPIARGEFGGEAQPEEGAKLERNQKPEQEEDGPLDPFFDLIDPAQVQRGLDQFLKARFDWDQPEKIYPEVPELGEPVFFDQVRPLGSKKYSNEFNYLLNPSTRNAPTLQVLEYEYCFADWQAVELDLSYFNGRLEILTPFYQRTLGVGQGGRSVRGLQISPDIYLRSGFVGGSATYMYGWKPTKKSRFSTLTFIGANRQLIGGFQFPAGPGSRLGATAPSALPTRAAGDDRVYGAWRPTLNINLFYKLTRSSRSVSRTTCSSRLEPRPSTSRSRSSPGRQASTRSSRLGVATTTSSRATSSRFCST